MKLSPSHFFACISTISGNTLEAIQHHTLRNYNSPICSNCIHYKPMYTYSNYDQTSGYCKRFGEVNIRSGEVHYDSIYDCRRDESKCGFHGKFYEYDEFKIFKVLKHEIVRNNYLIILTIPLLSIYNINNSY